MLWAELFCFPLSLTDFVQVSVNGVEVRAVKPGVYRHTITGMGIMDSKW